MSTSWKQRREGGSILSRAPPVINCRVARAARGARTRYHNLFSVEEKDIMGRVQEKVGKKRKSTMDDEILEATKEWVLDPGKSHTRDTKFFRLAEVY
jgi:hypothetical protein